MYIDRFEYFTFTCFNCSLERIKSFVFSKWGHSKTHTISHVPFKFDLYESRPLRGGAHFEKFYFFTPKHSKDQCVMVSNYSDGLSSLVYQITLALGVEAYNFRIASGSNPDTINAFSYIKNGDEIRTVYAMKDPQWVFYSQGEIQWFEDSESYNTRIIKKRLNKNILVSYCKKIGFDVNDNKFWESEQSILIERLEWDGVPE